MERMTDWASKFLRALTSSPKRWALVLVFLAGLSGAGYWGGRQLWAAHHLDAARKALARWRFDKARDHLSCCLRVWPQDKDLRLLAAQVARRARQLEEAKHHLDECRRLKGDPREIALEAALLRAQSGEVAGVEGELYQFVKSGHAATPLILEALALGYLQIYDLSSALACLNLLLKREPENSHALLWRGHVQSGMSRFDKALADYQRAVEIDPDNDEARLPLAENLCEKAGKPEEALPHFERLWRDQPDNARVARGLAYCYQALGKFDKAGETLDAFLAEHEGDAETLTARGEVSLQAGQLAAAEEWLERAVAGNSHSRRALFSLHQTLVKRGKEEKARHCHARLRQVEADLKELEKAVEAVGKNQRDPFPRYRAGVICLRNGEEQEALRWLYGALQLDPAHRPTRVALAGYFRQKGDEEKAASYLGPGEQ